ncbi:MAG: tRNA 2-thiouridine(34) synthase MnmA [candidate division KSB1 bacterium]|nr:tRNA 2-thiouridine(34) synthase MnmA [candidate division KSB1 bacterium]MDZ7293961.1 tRNA 2-thiouridine(34) synthase MnmA [candidate division KSB1 bacterium]MDZ7385060.1 tRNA 2-thiouridine(34) synthase MnmA [candidate division KSB1 bacterium]MDZ7392598.1 tRNA 2-thiouridine(34) synthase MnmA [candidate division KSB1 bacterium]MDZ7413189.1 tRNA 2-thiouridine(34) synthase MnmA [candidate division KSB1 bacterium]
MKGGGADKGTLVAVAMSGGVDSSVAAALLLEQGYAVKGLTMRLWEGAETHPQSCCSLEAVKEAQAVCEKLGIRHYIIDLRREFEREVVAHFVREYLAGRTPNPCVLCNARIKWGELLKVAMTLGATHIATGHYARVAFDPERRRFLLRKGADARKDQSYALWALTQEQLARTIFPLGEMHKQEVRQLAVSLGLPTADRPESQEVCFVPGGDYGLFLAERAERMGRTLRPGEVVDALGAVVGEHRGYPFYTIGQRKGVGVALGHPVYVVDIQPELNRVQVGTAEDLLSSGLEASPVNWVSEGCPEQGKRVTAKIRYKDPGFAAVVAYADHERLLLDFVRPQRAVTPGQSVVLYDGDVVVGGGVICGKRK